MNVLARHQPWVVAVDDEADILNLLVLILSKTVGADHVHACGTAAAALAFVQQEAVHLVITDYNMAGMNGLELTQHIKAQSPATRVVVVSGYFSPELQARVLAAGADYFIAKPFAFEQIIELVDTMLQPA